MPTLVKYATRSMSARRVLTAAAMLLSATTIASAQESFAPGEAYTTRFSGTVEFDVGDGTMAKIIDENGEGVKVDRQVCERHVIGSWG